MVDEEHGEGFVLREAVGQGGDVQGVEVVLVDVELLEGCVYRQCLVGWVGWFFFYFLRGLWGF